jgi:hypothetical protein
MAKTARRLPATYFRKCYLAWVWHNPHARDPAESLWYAARRMSRPLSRKAAKELAADAKAQPFKVRRADALAEWLEVDIALRDRLGLRTIGATDMKKRARTLRRKRKDRENKAAARLEKGARPHSESYAATEPWVEAGMSRATWYRHGKPRRETDSSTILLSLSRTDVSQPSKGTHEQASISKLPWWKPEVVEVHEQFARAGRVVTVAA